MLFKPMYTVGMVRNKIIHNYFTSACWTLMKIAHEVCTSAKYRKMNKIKIKTPKNSHVRLTYLKSMIKILIYYDDLGSEKS